MNRNDNSNTNPSTGEAPPVEARACITLDSYSQGSWRQIEDTLAVEKPLEIHVAGAKPLITMRTPGCDRELAAGLLYSEGVVQSPADIVYLQHSADQPDVMRVMLKPQARQRLDRIDRNTLANSACGVCGKPSFRVPDVGLLGRAERHKPALQTDWILSLPEQMRRYQGMFTETGGLHAAALFSVGGQLLHLREDVGRHNALDKLVGRNLLDGQLPLQEHALMLSGRASFELMQKAVVAGIPVVCAISAPSSFAVELAQQFDTTLIGFLRGQRFNLYSGAQRLASLA